MVLALGQLGIRWRPPWSAEGAQQFVVNDQSSFSYAKTTFGHAKLIGCVLATFQQGPL